MSTEQSESTPQDETHTAPVVDITQQAITPTATMRIKKIPSVWLLEKWLLKERGWPAPSSYLMVCGNYSMKRCPLPLLELRSVTFVRCFS